MEVCTRAIGRKNACVEVTQILNLDMEVITLMGKICSNIQCVQCRYVLSHFSLVPMCFGSLS